MIIKKEFIDASGTVFQDHINCTYDDLLNTFGKPTFEGGIETKIEVEWEVSFYDPELKFNEDHIATIYNWKDGIRYCGEEEGLEVKNIKEWHIGGHSQDAVNCVMKALNKYWSKK